MVYKSDDLWAAGSPEPSIHTQTLDFLRANEDDYFTAGEVAREIFDLPEPEEALQDAPEDKIELALNELFRYNLRAELVLEQFVEDGLVEKRLIRVSDQMDVLEDEHPEEFEDLDDDGPYDYLGARTRYYRIIETED